MTERLVVCQTSRQTNRHTQDTDVLAHTHSQARWWTDYKRHYRRLRVVISWWDRVAVVVLRVAVVVIITVVFQFTKVFPLGSCYLG